MAVGLMLLLNTKADQYNRINTWFERPKVICEKLGEDCVTDQAFNAPAQELKWTKWVIWENVH